MSEPTKINWKQPLTGKQNWLARFAIFAVILFVAVFGFNSLSDKGANMGELFLFSLIVAVVGSIALILIVRFFKYFLFGLACLVTLFLLGWAIENVRGKSAWKKELRDLEAAGEKINLADLTPRAVPDDQNFAMAPLLHPMLDFKRVDGRLVWNDTNGQARVEKIQVDLPTAKTNTLPLGSLEKSTFADVAGVAEFYRGNTNYPQATAQETAAETILTALGKFDAEVKELREAAKRPHSRFPIAYDEQPSWGILLPHLARIKSLTRVTHVRALAELEMNRPEEALMDLKLGFRISESIHEEPILIDHLVRLATVGINLQTIREGLIRHRWTDAQLAELEKQLQSINLLAEYHLAMRGERALSTSGLDWMRQQGFKINAMNYLGDEEGGGRSSGSFVVFPSGWFYQNMVAMSRLHKDYTLKAVDDKAHRVSADLCQELETALTSSPRGPYNIFASMLMPALGKAARKTARMQTAVDSARVACALERYRLAKGNLPEKLDELVPGFIAAIPNDVIDGQPLRYRRADDGGYVLYSIGWDKADSNGEIVLSKGANPGVDIAKGDWAWEMPAKL